MCRTDGTYQSCIRAGAFERQSWIDVLINLSHNLLTTSGLKDAAIHDTISIHELATEWVVSHQVAEEVVNICTTTCIHQLFQHIGASKGRIEVEEDEVELAVCSTAEALHVVRVRYPIRRTNEAIQSHIVHVFVNVEKVANLAVRFLRLVLNQFLGQILKLQPSLVITQLLIVLGITQVELVHIVEVNAVVAEGKVLVIAFANVEHSVIIAVQEDVSWLIVLAINIEATLDYHHLYGWVFDASKGIVTTIANLPATILIIWLRREDGITNRIHAFVLLICLQAERTPCLPGSSINGCATISPRIASTNLKVHLLVQHQRIAAVAILVLNGNQILHVYWPLPIHIPIAGTALTIAAHSVGTLNEDANFVVEEVLGF